jgi:uncharacterized glyoxalase superfamily protein PhnB
MDRGPVFSQVNVVAEDFEAAVGFYRLLGLDVPEEEGDHREVSEEGTASFELDGLDSVRLWNASWRTADGGAPVVLGFTLASRAAVDEAYAALTAAGHPGVQPPFDAFWGARYAIVADPAGNQVGLMSPRDADRQAWPPTPSPDPA